MALPSPKKSGNDAAGMTGNADAMFSNVGPHNPKTSGAADAGENTNADGMFHVIGENADKSASDAFPEHMQNATMSLSAGGKAPAVQGLAGTDKRNAGAPAELKARKGRGEDRSYRKGDTGVKGLGGAGQGGDPLNR